MQSSGNNNPGAAMLVDRALTEFVQKKAVTLTASGRPLMAGKPVTEAQLLDSLRLFAVDYTRAFKTTFNVLVGYQDFVSGWNLFKPKMLEASLKELRDRVRYSVDIYREGRASLDMWLQGVLFREPTDVERAVLLHFIWQVKRKLFGKPAYFHMMPVFVSAQGTGKTTAIQMLVEPLKEVVSNTTLEQFTDQRTWATLSRTYIKVVDEMAMAERTDMATLKMVLSSEGILEYRPMRSNELEQVIQNNTFIGTSNEEISGLIRDYTGVRRFFQLVGHMEPIHLSDAEIVNRYWNLLSAANIVSIWQSVDESLEILPEFKANQKIIAQVQTNELQARTSFDEFWDMPGYGFEWADPETPGARKYTGRDIYELYKVFCENHGLDPTYSAIRITKILKFRAPQSSMKNYDTCRNATFFLKRLQSSNLSGKLTVLHGKNEDES